MSATDNAFIKVYKYDPAQAVRRPKLLSSARSRVGVVTSVDVPADESLEEISLTESAIPVASTDSKQEVEVSDTETAVDFTNKRIQQRHTSIPAPHIPVAKFEKSVDTADSRQIPSAFSAAWEVDAFQWPRICDDLQKNWAAPLTGVVRNVVREAWRGSNIVTITQFDRGEGATTLSLCLARIAASFHIRVALVDGNIRNPDVATSLGVTVEQGWESISASLPIEELAVGSIADRFVIFPLDVATTNDPSRGIDPGTRLGLLDRLSREFELVVVDTGPVYVAAHGWYSQPCVGRIGNTLIVRDVRRTDEAQLEDVCKRLSAAGVVNMSVVENFQFG